jgi:hypothetical protein
VFLDVSRAFDRVWHSGLLYKIKQFLPPPYFQLLKSYLSDRQFQVRVRNEKSELQPMKAGVSQGSVLGPTLYVLYTSDLPTSTNTTLGIFADDTVILSVNEDSRSAASDLQHHLNTLQAWFEKWRIRMSFTTLEAYINLFKELSQCSKTHRGLPGKVTFNVTSTGNAGCFKKGFTIVFSNVTVWRVSRKRLQLKAYKLSVVEDLDYTKVRPWFPWHVST